jgi:hypothetical protein
MRLRHMRHVKKTANNEEIRTFKESNLIEGLWGVMKQNIKHSYNTLIGDESVYFTFVMESLWRRQMSRLESP